MEDNQDPNLGQTGQTGDDDSQEPTWQKVLRDEGTPDDQSGATQDDEGVAPPPPAAGGIGPAELEAILQKFAPSSTQTPQTPQLSQDDINRLLNVVAFGEDHVKGLGLESTPERVSLLNQVAQAISKQAVTIASYYQKLQMQEMQDKFAPIMQFVEEARSEQMKVRFFNEFPDLKGLDALLIRIKDAYIKEGRQFKDESEAFQAVAKDARSIIETARKHGNGQAPSGGGTQQQTKPAKKMPALSGGGQGGAGDSGSADANVPNWRKKKVFG